MPRIMLLLMFGLSFCLAGCGGDNTAVHVISREDGSGTRSAFVELFGIEEKNASGEKVDMTTTAAQITNNTAVMLTSVAGDDNAIGYVSLGSLNKSVKAVNIDGTAPTVENVQSGAYKAVRYFSIVEGTREQESAAKDFLNFILSQEGQNIVAESGYVPLENADEYKKTPGAGKIVVAGSSSVTPVMEKLAEAYQKLNGQVTIEVQQSDSTTGINAALDNLADFGMSSRSLKAVEKERGAKEIHIAADGIAVIVSKGNKTEDLSSAEVKAIFTGNVSDWSK